MARLLSFNASTADHDSPDRGEDLRNLIDALQVLALARPTAVRAIGRYARQLAELEVGPRPAA